MHKKISVFSTESWSIFTKYVGSFHPDIVSNKLIQMKKA